MGFVSLSSSSDDVKRGTNISAMRKLLVIKTYLLVRLFTVENTTVYVASS